MQELLFVDSNTRGKNVKSLTVRPSFVARPSGSSKSSLANRYHISRATYDKWAKSICAKMKPESSAL